MSWFPATPSAPAWPCPPLSREMFVAGSGQETRVCFYVVLTGHGDAKKVLLRLSDLPFVQLFQKRETGAPFLDSSDPFDKDLTEATVAKRLAVALFEARGDASSTVQVLLGYYKYKSQPRRSNNCRKKSSSPTPDSQPHDDGSRQEPDYPMKPPFQRLSPWLTENTTTLFFRSSPVSLVRALGWFQIPRSPDSTVLSRKSFLCVTLCLPLQHRLCIPLCRLRTKNANHLTRRRDRFCRSSLAYFGPAAARRSPITTLWRRWHSGTVATLKRGGNNRKVT